MRMALAVAVLVTATAVGLRAEAPADSLQFNLSRCRQDLCVSVDLSPLITGPTVGRIRGGVELAVVCRAALERPRRFWGAAELIRTSTRLLARYTPLTGQYTVVLPQRSEDSIRNFSSLAGLHRFFADSLVLPVYPLDSLDPSQQYRVRVQAEGIWQTPLSSLLDDTEETADPVRFLFRQFLHLTGYGRFVIAQESRLFSLDELPTSE